MHRASSSTSFAASNTNRSHRLKARSRAAQASIEKYASHRPPLLTAQEDAVHTDHVYPFTAELLNHVNTVEE